MFKKKKPNDIKPLRYQAINPGRKPKEPKKSHLGRIFKRDTPK